MVDDLATLEARVSAGFTWLYEREVSGRKDAHYDTWLENWLAMLQDLEYRLTHLGLTKADCDVSALLEGGEQGRRCVESLRTTP